MKRDKAEEKDGNFLMEIANPTEYLKMLQEGKKSFEYNPTFKPGDLITWKEGLQSKTVPDKGIPGIVINNYYPALKEVDAEIGSAYFSEILDIQVGFITKEGDFIIFAHDSRRFKLFDFNSK